MREIWRTFVIVFRSQVGTSNLPLVALLAFLVFLVVGPFSDTAGEVVGPVVKHLRRLLR